MVLLILLNVSYRAQRRFAFLGVGVPVSPARRTVLSFVHARHSRIQFKSGALFILALGAGQMAQDALPLFALCEFIANIPCRLRRIGRKERNKQPLASENGIEGGVSSSGEDEDECEEKDSGEGFVVVGGCFGYDTRHAIYIL